MEKVSVDYELNEKDFIDFNLARRNHTILPVAICLFFIISIIFQLVNQSNLWMTILWIAIFGAYLLYPFYMAKQTIKNMPQNYRKVHLECDNVGFCTSNDQTAGYQKNWDTIYECKEYKKQFAIFIDKKSATMIPKRALNEKQSDALRNLFAAQAQNKKNALAE